MTWPRWCACTAATPSASTAVTATARQTWMSSVVPVPRRACRRSSASERMPSSSTAPSKRASAPKASSSGAPASASTTWAESVPASAATSSSPPRRQVSRAGTVRATRSGRPRARAAQGRMRPTATVPMTAAPAGDRHRQQRAQVEVLQGVDVVDGAGEQVAAAPPGQRGGHPGGQAVVEPQPPAGQRAQRGVVADEAFGVAQRPAEEGEHLDGGQDADEGGQAGAQRGPADDVARPGQQADGRRGGGQAEQPRQRQPPVGRARLGQDAAERSPGPASRRDRQREAGRRRQRHHGVEVGEEERLVRRHHDGAPCEPGLDRRREAGHGRRVERGRGLVEQQDGRRAQQGAGQGDALALARTQGEAVVADGRRRARPAGCRADRRGPRPRARRRGRRRTRRARPAGGSRPGSR